MSNLTDLEITKLCAEAMGYSAADAKEHAYGIGWHDGYEWVDTYQPLHDDAQAMALVKKLNLQIQSPAIDGQNWHCWKFKAPNHTGLSTDLNRAICTCVAHLMKEKANG